MVVLVFIASFKLQQENHIINNLTKILEAAIYKLFFSKILLLILVPAGLLSCSSGKKSASGDGNSIIEKKHQAKWKNSLFKKSAYLFDDSRVHRLEITIDPNTLTEVVLGGYRIDGDKQYGLAKELRLDGESIKHIGIRSRGAFSARNYKRQFKISFNCARAYTEWGKRNLVKRPGLRKRRFHGVRKINLRASRNDPSIIREKLAADIFQHSGVPAPRVAFAKVYINNDYWGLYLMVEQIDNALLKSRFGEDSGSLYKGVRGAARFDSNSIGRGWELKTNKKKKNNKDLENFLTTLENARTRKELGKLVDVDNVLSYLAGAALSGHWDSFAGLGNNDYLYKHSDGRFRIVVWDLDNTFGSGIGWGFPIRTASVFCLRSGTNYDRLFNKLLAIPALKKLYIQKVRRLLTLTLNTGSFYQKIAAYKAMIKDAVYADPRKQVDWRVGSRSEGNKTWEESFTRKPQLWRGRGFGWYNGGLKGWIKDRAVFIKKQLSE